MNHHPEQIEKGRGTFITYLFGFIISIALTLTAYFTVAEHLLTDNALVITIIVCGIFQACIQLFFFLHVGDEEKPRWNLLVFLFMALVILIIVFGSLWIMKNLTYNVMPSMETLHTS